MCNAYKCFHNNKPSIPTHFLVDILRHIPKENTFELNGKNSRYMYVELLPELKWQSLLPTYSWQWLSTKWIMQSHDEERGVRQQSRIEMSLHATGSASEIKGGALLLTPQSHRPGRHSPSAGMEHMLTRIHAQLLEADAPSVGISITLPAYARVQPPTGKTSEPMQWSVYSRLQCVSEEGSLEDVYQYQLKEGK